MKVNEPVEIVMARTYKMIGECRVKLEWTAWDAQAKKWLKVPSYSRILDNLSPARASKLEWDLTNFVDRWRKENISE